MRLADRDGGRRMSARTQLRFGLAAIVSGAVVASAAFVLTGSSSHKGADTLALSGNNSSSMQMSSSAANGYQVLSLNDKRDLTFNQLLGINNQGVIAGYFGSGAQGHPNKGYVLLPPFAQTAAQNDFLNENFPHSVQTQVTGLNDTGITVGFWSKQNTANMANNNFGFYEWHGRFHSVNFPTGTPANPPVDQLLGVNDFGIAVGFFTNSAGTNRGYEYNIRSGHFSRVLPPDAHGSNLGSSLSAAGINNRGDVAGFYNKTANQVDAFLKTRSGRFTTIACPGAAMTQAFGVNDSREVVGAYTTGSGNTAVTHGFTWTAGTGCTTVNIGGGATATTINGVNNEGDLVGFFTDAKGNTEGFFALPQ
jgi:hypothetical protein